jgi:flagellar hook-length control protein FliK
MNAASLPTTQPAMPAGFAAFLTNIGQVSDGGGESLGFDQIFAAAPTAPAASIAPEQFLPVEVAAPVADAPTVETPVAKAEPGDADSAAVKRDQQRRSERGGAPVAAPANGKPVPAESESDAAPEATPEAANAGETTTIAPAANWIAVAAAVTPTSAKPAKGQETPAAPDRDAAAAAPLAARPRDALQTLTLALAGAEAPVGKPVEAAPSMTVQFAQLALNSAATLTDAAAPALVAERVLNLDSDGAWIDQLAHDIAATKSDSGDISFRLMPRHLGRLDVAMQMGDEGVSLKMDTHHEATATIVTAAQARLVDELRQQGVRVAGAEVTCTPGETGRQSQGQGRAAATDPTHLIETATERAEPRDEDRAADRRGRFA